MTLNKDTYHKRSTHYEPVAEIITNPTDKIAVHDRATSILGKYQRRTRFDDEAFVNLDEDNKKTQKRELSKQN